MPSGERRDETARLRRSLGRGDLTAMGVGTMVGAGIFVTTGIAAAQEAGPAIVLSFALAGAVCVLVALCYAELAAMVPVSGSAYTYTRHTLGPATGFLVGWTLLLEYVVAGAAVAIGWSGMLGAALDDLFGVALPRALTAGPTAEGGVVNLPAVLIVALTVLVLAGEVRFTARVTKALVALTVGVLVVVIAVGAPNVTADHWTPFAPFGLSGVIGGAALAFFAFLGFDVVATSAEESRDPRRDLPFAIIVSILVATGLYMAVSAVLTGVAPYPDLNNATPVATAFEAVDAGWIGSVVLIASVVALTKGLLMILYGQTRLLFAMCRDGLLPPSLARTAPRTGAPVRPAVLLGLLGALIAGFTSIEVVAELTNIGALFAFAAVCAGVLVLRRSEPGRERPFRTPLVPALPLAALGGCALLASTLAGLTWLRFAAWLAAGLALYAAYGRTAPTRARGARSPGTRPARDGSRPGAAPSPVTPRRTGVEAPQPEAAVATPIRPGAGPSAPGPAPEESR
ncbi:amino acid permease [Streptomyces sp. DSM 44917]|uniref:Amino acid permease n=1 Tax=Streptomyces boetiae TaxID=3075541 RepID=A0ABU2LEX1_9ACTN|nr:amino acid permease [Streptomyces sp. DSM 44917]MDT0310142.1 amino acid permease [Streptomyces sp. DSM 44917]